MPKPKRKEVTYVVEKFRTPVGAAAWAKLKSPDRTHNPDGVWRVDVVLEPEAAAPLEAQLAALAERAIAEIDGVPEGAKVHLGVGDHEVKDPATDRKVKTGKRVARTKLKAVRMVDDVPIPQRPLVFDASRRLLTGDQIPLIGNGSKVIAFGDAIARYVQDTLYVSLDLKAVQIIELVAPNTFDADAYGMEEVAGGFAAGAGAPEGEESPAY